LKRRGNHHIRADRGLLEYRKLLRCFAKAEFQEVRIAVSGGKNIAEVFPNSAKFEARVAGNLCEIGRGTDNYVVPSRGKPLPHHKHRLNITATAERSDYEFHRPRSRSGNAALQRHPAARQTR
jgi:hypothetical protein